jgi:uncharacterized CHY-type Zn-finger protein
MKNKTQEELLKSDVQYVTKEGNIILQNEIEEYKHDYNSSVSPIYDSEDVARILNADTEKQRNCYMCHAQIGMRPFSIKEYQKLFKQFTRNFNSNEIETIEYCQWCGRKLRKWEVVSHHGEKDETIESEPFKFKEDAEKLMKQLNPNIGPYTVREVTEE